MLQIFRSAVLVLLVFVLVACGADDANTDTTIDDTDDTVVENTDSTTETDDTDTEDETEQNAQGETVVTISGAEEFTFEQDIKFGCVEDLIHIQTFTQSPKFDLYLPASIEAGTYALADFDANSAVSYVEGEAVLSISGNLVPGSGSGYGSFYFQNSEGQLVIESMPAAAGEYFAATISGTLQNSDGETITVDATLNLEAESSLMLDCQF